MQFAIKQYDLTFIITKLTVVMMSTVLISMLTWIHGTSVKGNIILWLEIDVSASADRYSQILQESTNHPIFCNLKQEIIGTTDPLTQMLKSLFNKVNGLNEGLKLERQWFQATTIGTKTQSYHQTVVKLLSKCCQIVTKLSPRCQKCHINNFDQHPYLIIVIFFYTDTIFG